MAIIKLRRGQRETELLDLAIWIKERYITFYTVDELYNMFFNELMDWQLEDIINTASEFKEFKKEMLKRVIKDIITYEGTEDEFNRYFNKLNLKEVI